MSEEKIYLIKNDHGEYLTVERTAPWWNSPVGTAVRNIDIALAWAEKHGGHVVTLIEEPKKVVLSKEQAQVVKEARDAVWPAKYITDHSDNSNGLEELLMNAYVNGYTIKKEKRYKVLAPNSWWNEDNTPEYLSFGGFGVNLTKHSDDIGTVFTQKQLNLYGLNGAPFTKEEVTDDDD
ncbi:DUF1642 domain-containing protein [Lacticaseibacillus rhamnosus]|uniref:DUF1642 domain-containing protein n=1 Tax=Lacticaseibacillus rhamnosus TaxID=47715 RepID=UPI0007E23C10|nr:DUF1642 domain-containing protein [Lacticaseibacillus rhamnosus]OAU79714.1 phage protein [Lacticaseibacillus rhamnosus]